MLPKSEKNQQQKTRSLFYILRTLYQFSQERPYDLWITLADSKQTFIFFFQHFSDHNSWSKFRDTIRHWDLQTCTDHHMSNSTYDQPKRTSIKIGKILKKNHRKLCMEVLFGSSTVLIFNFCHVDSSIITVKTI